MRRTLVSLFFILGTIGAYAVGNTSVYTHFDLANCRLIEPADDYVHAGTWACDGNGGIDIIQSIADDRSLVAFGKNGQNHCAYRKTFGPFNTALSPIEWRLRNGKPFAAIERWNVGEEFDPAAASWLVVTALRANESCHVHYVAGSYPKANEQARRAADDLAEGFDCENGVPSVDSKVGSPPIEFASCQDLPME